MEGNCGGGEGSKDRRGGSEAADRVGVRQVLILCTSKLHSMKNISYRTSQNKKKMVLSGNK